MTLGRLRSFAAQSTFVQVWFLPVWLSLGVATLAIHVLPLRKIAPRLGRSLGTDPVVTLASPRNEARALEIGRVVRMGARYSPWRSDCYPQALVARGLMALHRVPGILYFGVRRGASGRFEAHAWIRSGRIAVTGGHGFGQFTVVAQFQFGEAPVAAMPQGAGLWPRHVGALASGRLDPLALDETSFAQAQRHGLALAMAAALPPGAGGEGAPMAARVAALTAQKRRATLRVMAVVGMLARIDAILGAAGLRYLTLKGPALALRTTGDWRARNSTDLDILIAPEDLAAAHAALVAAGFRRRDGRAGPPTALFRAVQCETVYVDGDGDGVPVDLHWRMDVSPAVGRLPFDALWQRGEPVTLGPVTTRAPGAADAFLLTALHGSKSGWTRWAQVLDAVRQWRRLTPADRDTARRRAETTGCVGPLRMTEALVALCSDDGVRPIAEHEWLARAARVLDRNRLAPTPRRSARAAAGRLFRSMQMAPDPLAAAGMVVRAVARVALSPALYRGHLRR